MPSLPPLPSASGSYPSARYVNIVDGVAATLHYSNNSYGTYDCSMVIEESGLVQVPYSALVTNNFDTTKAPLIWQPSSPTTNTPTWHLTTVSVAGAPNGGGSPYVSVSYSGGSLPAMNSNNAFPAGVTITEAPWQIESGSVRDGYMLANPSVNPYAYQSVYFVPNFLIAADAPSAAALTTSGPLTSNAANVWHLTFSKFLTPQQGPFTISATLTGLGVGSSPVTLPAVMTYNSSGQANGINVSLTAAQVGNGYGGTSTSGALTINVTQPLHYLNGSNFTTNPSLSLLSYTFPLTAPNVTDTTPPIGTAQLLTSGTTFQAGIVVAYLNPSRGLSPLYESVNLVGGTVNVSVSAQDAESGLDRVELWAMAPGYSTYTWLDHDVIPANTLLTTYPFSGDPTTPQALTLSFSNPFDNGSTFGRGRLTTLYLKTYNGAGYVASIPVLPAVGSAGDTILCTPPTTGQITINFTANTSGYGGIALSWGGTLTGPGGYSRPISFAVTLGAPTASLVIPGLAFGAYTLTANNAGPNLEGSRTAPWTLTNTPTTPESLTIDAFVSPNGVMVCGTEAP